MRQGHEFQEEPDTVTSLELTALLHELHEPDSWLSDQDDDNVTVSAVAEATGHSETEIQELLERLREEDKEIRLSRALREMEEPLYRVERPGPTPHDPLAAHFRLRPGQSLSPLLDGLAKKRRVRKVVEDKSSELVGRIILYVFAGLFLVLCLAALLRLFVQ